MLRLQRVYLLGVVVEFQARFKLGYWSAFGTSKAPIPKSAMGSRAGNVEHVKRASATFSCEPPWKSLRWPFLSRILGPRAHLYFKSGVI